MFSFIELISHEYRFSFFEIDNMFVDEIILLIERIRERSEDEFLKNLMMIRIRMLSIHDPSECSNVLDKMENRYKVRKELTYGN